MHDEIITKGLPHKELAPILEKLKRKVFSHSVTKKIFEEYDISSEEQENIVICFAQMPVSARTDHGVIYINVDLIKDGDIEEDDHYLPHELTHYCQQTNGNKPTPGSGDDDYLDNPAEQEGFQNQTKYISKTQGKDEAKEYIDQLLDYHDVKNGEREDREDQLLELASSLQLSLKK
ncbi:MAG: hypothetical protein WC942_06195 [Clostridia bacterium]|jgi:hypothetical protein